MNLNSFVQFVICRMWKHFACQQPLDLHLLWRPLSTKEMRTCVCVCVIVVWSNSCLQISLNGKDIVCGDVSLPENVQLSDRGPVANKICCSRATGWREERGRRVQRCWTAHSKSSREGHRCSSTGTNLRQCGWENIVLNQFVRCRIPFAQQEFTSTFEEHRLVPQFLLKVPMGWRSTMSRVRKARTPQELNTKLEICRHLSEATITHSGWLWTCKANCDF